MSTILAVAFVLGCAGCQTPVVPDPNPEPTPYDIWTTPPPGEDAPRITRTPRATPTIVPKGWRADAEVSFLNRYVWRGILVTDDPVFQPAANVGYGDFRLNVWANMDLTNANGNSGQFNEVDLALEWLHCFDETVVPFRLFAGAIVYFFPNTAFPTTTELYGGVSLAIPTNPTLTVYRDIDEVDGWYGSFHLTDDVDLGCGFALSGRIGIGWGDRSYDRSYFGVAESGFNDFHVALSLPWTRGRWTVKPFVGWQSLVDESLRRATARSEALIYGLTVGATL